MQNYNLIHNEPEDISNPDDLEGSGVLKSQFFEVTAGIPTVTISELIGARILSLIRENSPYKEVVALTVGRQFMFDDSTGDFVFPTDFNPNEQLFVLYYTGTAPVTYSEPVTLDEIKDYLRLQGFTDVDGSTSDFDTDDTLIQELIIGAREKLERELEITIVTKALRVTITNLAGLQNIPLGPVNAITSFKDCNGTEITNYVLTGSKYPEIKSPRSADLTIEYIAGFPTVPKRLITAMKKQVAWDYVNRGDKDAGISQDALKAASSFSRKSVFL